MEPELDRLLSISETELTKLQSSELAELLGYLKKKQNGVDFLTFCREILKLKTPRHYLEWQELAQSSRRLLIEAHRDSWKSFFWSRAYPLFKAASRPGSTLCLVSYSEAQARKNLYWIKQMLETIPELCGFVPKSNTFTWQKTFLHLTNGSTIEAKGFGSAMRGGHFDIIICDDILKDGSSMPHEDQQNFFFGVITPACRKTGQIVVVGTPLEHGDLLEHLEKNETYVFKSYPAIVGGKVWFDEEYTLDNIEQWKQESPNYWYFAREYLLQRINPDKASFKEHWIQYYNPRDIADTKLFKVMTIDPALTEKGDYNGMVVTGTDSTNTCYILDAVQMRGELTAIIDRIFALYDKHQPDIVGSEMFGFQKYLKFWLEDEMVKRNKFFNIVQLEAGQKKSKAMRILGLQPRIEMGKMKFRKKEDMDIIAELLSFDFSRQKNKDDLCLAGGTKIATPTGDKNIEHIRPGDRVITPFGNKKVVASSWTGHRGVITKFGITATPSHKVFNAGWFCPLDALTYQDENGIMSLWKLLRWKYLRTLYLTEHDMLSWGRESITLASLRGRQIGSVPRDFMLRFMNFIQDKRFQKASMFTIKMAIHLTMTFLTWNAYRLSNIINSQKILTRQRLLPIWTKLDHWLRRGTSRKLGGSGTKITQKNNGLTQNTNYWFAGIVRDHSNRQWETPKAVLDFATTGAGIRKENVCDAAAHSRESNIESQTIALGHVECKQDVYNIAVEDIGCYYANGVLVSNCDALAYQIPLIHPPAKAEREKRPIGSFDDIAENSETQPDAPGPGYIKELFGDMSNDDDQESNYIST